MKKYLNIALAALLGAGLAACSDDPELGIPSVNPQEPLMPAQGVTASDAVAAGGSVDLNAAGENGSVKMLTITELSEDFPASSQLAVVMNVAADENMTDARAIELTLTPATEGTAVYEGYASADEWTSLFRSMVSRDPAAKSMWVNYVAYAVNENQRVLLGTVGEKQEVVVTPIAPDYVIETAYYVHVAGASFADAQQFMHEGNVYDNPEFTVVLNVEESQLPYTFQVIPQSTKDAAQEWDANHALVFYGPGQGGLLAPSTPAENAHSFIISDAGRYELKVNMETLAYGLQSAAEYLYVPGGGNGWSFSTMLGTDNYVNYRGFAYLDGQFKFTNAPDWGAPGNFGNAGDNKTLQNGSNDNFSVDGPADLYYLDVNLGTMTFTKTAITKIAIIGSVAGINWDHSKSIAMTPDDATKLAWSVTLNLEENGEWKFAMNGGWDINLGAAADAGTLRIDGGNIKVTADEAGTRTIHLDLSTVPYQWWIE